MKANSTCTLCGCRWYLRHHESDVTCDRKRPGKGICGGQVVRDETREILENLARNFVTYNR